MVISVVLIVYFAVIQVVVLSIWLTGDCIIWFGDCLPSGLVIFLFCPTTLCRF